MLIRHRPANLAAGLIRQRVEDAESHQHVQIGIRFANAPNDPEKEPGAAVEIAAKRAGTSAGTQKLVQQVAMTSFDIDKLIADIASQARGGEEGVNEALQVAIGPND